MTEILTPEAIAALAKAAPLIPEDRDYSDMPESTRLDKLRNLLNLTNRHKEND